jgi:hypothetical protein
MQIFCLMQSCAGAPAKQTSLIRPTNDSLAPPFVIPERRSLIRDRNALKRFSFFVIPARASLGPDDAGHPLVELANLA